MYLIFYYALVALKYFTLWIRKCEINLFLCLLLYRKKETPCLPVYSFSMLQNICVVRIVLAQLRH
jgi:hypothetical protein